MTTTRFSLSEHTSSDRAGAAAAESAAATIRAAIDERGSARIVLAAAPSQSDLYRYLAEAPDIDWSKVEAFHMDEYLGLDPRAPQRFSQWLRARFVSKVPALTFHPLLDLPASATAGDPGAVNAEIDRYARQLATGPIDLICLGIGVNGHIAFNDPPDADFTDPATLRVVPLSDASRIQQVDDECFDELADVPERAVTVTIPSFMAARHLVCTVPGERKAEAVAALVSSAVTTQWPCTILRTHPHCEVHVDRAAASLLKPGRSA